MVGSFPNKKPKMAIVIGPSQTQVIKIPAMRFCWNNRLNPINASSNNKIPAGAKGSTQTARSPGRKSEKDVVDTLELAAANIPSSIKT